MISNELNCFNLFKKNKINNIKFHQNIVLATFPH